MDRAAAGDLAFWRDQVDEFRTPKAFATVIDALLQRAVDETPLASIWESPRYRAFRQRARSFDFSPCIDCGGCDLREKNEDDCFGSGFPSCGDCLWAAGFIQCP